jgi:hypothetical protein
MTADEFYKKYASAAQIVQTSLGIDKNTILAWWSWETAFGTNKGAKYNNLGGIKYTKNADSKVQDGTIAYSGYNSTEAYAKDFVRVLSVNAYGYPAVINAAKTSKNDVAAVTRAMNDSSYAEDPYNITTIAARAKAAAAVTGGMSFSSGTTEKKPEPTSDGGSGRFASIPLSIRLEIKRKAEKGIPLEIKTPLKLELYKLYQKENR